VNHAPQYLRNGGYLGNRHGPGVLTGVSHRWRGGLDWSFRFEYLDNDGKSDLHVTIACTVNRPTRI